MYVRSWGYSIADGLKDTSRYTRLLGLQEFQISRAASYPVKAPLLKCQMFANCFIDLYDILNENVLVTLCQEEEHAGYKATLSGNAMIRLSANSTSVIFWAVPHRRTVR